MENLKPLFRNKPLMSLPSEEVNRNLKRYFTANSRFSNKSIQKNFKFLVELSEPFGKYIRPFHILKIDLPTSYGFQMEKMQIGPYVYTWPTMKHDGFDFTITFEEDDKGTIAKMIHVFQSMIVSDNDDADGTYKTQMENRIGYVTINIYDDAGNEVQTIIFRSVYFLNATGLNLDYESNDSVKYVVTLHSDFMEKKFNA